MLARFLSADNEKIRHAKFTALVRGEQKARIFEAQGMTTVLFEGFDDHERIRQVASEHDSKFRSYSHHLLFSNSLTLNTIVVVAHSFRF